MNTPQSQAFTTRSGEEERRGGKIEIEIEREMEMELEKERDNIAR